LVNLVLGSGLGHKLAGVAGPVNGCPLVDEILRFADAGFLMALKCGEVEATTATGTFF
jgi:hypothetical protein